MTLKMIKTASIVWLMSLTKPKRTKKSCWRLVMTTTFLINSLLFPETRVEKAFVQRKFSKSQSKQENIVKLMFNCLSFR
jgi:hypothetical protein